MRIRLIAMTTLGLLTALSLYIPSRLLATTACACNVTCANGSCECAYNKTGGSCRCYCATNGDPVCNCET